MDRLTELQKYVADSRLLWWNKVIRNFPNVGTIPDIKINKRLKTTAGRMDVAERVMDLSYDLLDLYPIEFGKNIIPHEFAHQVAYDIYGIGKNKGRNNWHGAEWCSVMGALGVPPETYHNMVNVRYKKK